MHLATSSGAKHCGLTVPPSSQARKPLHCHSAHSGQLRYCSLLAK